MQRVDYIKKVAAYIGRIYNAKDPQEKLFFAQELEKFVQRNDGTCEWPEWKFNLKPRKPRLTAKDLIFLRDMKVSL